MQNENKEKINKIENLEENDCEKLQNTENNAEISAKTTDFTSNNAIFSKEDLTEIKNLIDEINSFEDYKDELFDDDNYIPNNNLNYTINTDTGEVIRVKKAYKRRKIRARN